MKRIIQLFAIFALLFGCFSSHLTTTKAKEAYDILSHVVDVTVNEDGALDVTETMSLHFTEKRHGIYVNLPTKYNMTWDVDNQQVYKSYTFPITNISVVSSHEYETETYDGGVQIKIGSAGYYANEYETYIFKYTILTKDLDLDGQQMLVLNLLTNGWGSGTEDFSFSIKMPKSFDSNKMVVSYPEGILKGEGSANGLTVSVNGNTIFGSYKNASASDQLSIKVELTNGYFNFPDINDTTIYGVIFSIALGLICTAFYMRYGKDDPLIITAEYHAPVDLDSAQVGIIIDEAAEPRDIISLLLDWGRRGIITIEETETDLVLRKEKDLEPTAHDYERTVFDRLFDKSNTRYVSSLEHKFYETLNKAERELTKFYSSAKRRLCTPTSITVQVVFALLVPFVVLVPFAVAYYSYYRTFTCVYYCIALWAIMLCGMLLICTYVQYRYVWHLPTKIFGLFAIALIYAGPIFVVCAIMYSWGVSLINILAIISIALLGTVEVGFMRKRTLYGNEKLGQVLGLREFIMNAKKEKLEDILEENPYYFYDILPYAYALDLTNIWNEHFKQLTVEPCEWYHPYDLYDRNTYYMMHSMNSHFDTMQRSMTSTPPSSSSGGSSSFSSGGGGGGFGGSSGGSW